MRNVMSAARRVAIPAPEVLSGGILRVLSGGTAGRKALSGGEQRVAEGGTAGDTTVSGGASRHDR
jgi:hypothetical protein